MATAKLRSLLASKTVHRIGFAVSLVIFAAGLWLSIRNMPNLPNRIAFAPLVFLLLLGAPISMMYNSLEFFIVARIGGKRLPWHKALEVTVYATASGSVFGLAGWGARFAAMKVHKISVGRGMASSLLFTSLGVGASLLYSAAALAFCNVTAWFWFACSGGAFVIIACIGLYRLKTNWRVPVLLLSIRLVLFILTAIRYLLAIESVGGHINFIQGSVFVAVQSLGTLQYVIPANLGVTEAFSAGLATLIGVPANIGFLAAAVGRVVWMAGQIATSAVAAIGIRWLAASHASSTGHEDLTGSG